MGVKEQSNRKRAVGRLSEIWINQIGVRRKLIPKCRGLGTTR